jgi:subtilisin family serine protease
MTFWDGLRGVYKGYSWMRRNKDYQMIPPEQVEVKEEPVVSLSETIDWGLVDADIPSVWKDTKGDGITIAVLDTGVCVHDDLKDNLIARYDKTGEGIDRGGSHATHVAGIIAASDNGTGVVGVAPNAKIISIKVLKSNGTGSIKNVVDGLKMCETLDCDIVNLSLGMPRKGPQEMHEVIKRLRSQGKIVVAAAGNNKKKVNFPARWDECIAVAAMDKNDKLAKFASKGPEVDIIAPGVDVYSTVCGNKYQTMDGSSMSTPFFSGIIALILSLSRSNDTEIRSMFKIDKYEDLLDIIDKLTDPERNFETRFAGKSGDTGYGFPDFENFKRYYDAD